MNKILLLILIGFIASEESKNIIIIGDSRIHEMGYTIFGLGDTKFYSSRYYTNYYAMITPEPVSYNDYNIQIAASQEINKLISADYPIYSEVVSLLNNAAEGTNVLFHMGFDGNSLYNFNNIVNFIGKLADKYPKLNFYFVSLIGVDESYTKITNSDIKDFNIKMENRIEIVEFDNLKYKSILNEGNPTQIILGDEVIEILNYVSEGTGFFKKGYSKILDALIEGF